ncbi:MAG TPA: ankyrin repeat domain-containing protein [Candidatus Acidoferrales bacterium]|nr:ankyrin repeat domain-containing protein [Candidatus Acidoferrales bacterium]
MIERVLPTYPPIAKTANVEGDVKLTLAVDQSGDVVRVVTSSGPALLKNAAETAAEHYHYRPFEMNGKAADVLVEAVVSFRLHVQTPPVPFPEVTDIKSVRFEYTDGSIDIRVNGDGRVEYDGQGTGVAEGKHTRLIKAQEVQMLLDSFRKANFFSLNDDYSVSATDVGSETTSIQIGDRQKAVTDNYVQKPAVLDEAQKAILKYSHSDQWTKGNSDTVPGLVAETPNPTARKEVLSNDLPAAALYGDTVVVREILAYPVDLNREGPFKDTALMLAADRGSADMVDALLKAGADPHRVDEFGRNALIFGAGCGNSKVVQLLLSAGLRADSKDKYGDTALMAAAAAGNPESVRLFLNNGAEANATNSRRQTALLSGATGDSGFGILEMGRPHPGIPEVKIHRDVVVGLLLDAGANINARGWFGETALFSLEEDAVRELIRRHANLEARDDSGETPLIDTVSGSIAEILIKAGADVNARDKDGKTALIRAAESNYVDKLEVLVKAPGIHLEERDNDSETALMRAKANNLPASVAVLVAAGATH